ncbi:FAD-dependent oxidoreductase [Hoeflea prorocentri]|uniref:FAD-dependent oxidoreductase n=1 Tax=Hoeflea prorocentri TaxID=1922333 RepID=A0A9X3UPW6_9HYPH|nr:FAD-dependent oxidoreductase [Hoeflea prorocentri]MCY6383209.1 FAD-dependent oxidoreductase [Hoeflea prorocentri]MDA5401009.1 FAD-dependent oxidoreductase [Hoeflea prorocentri]
MTELNPVSVPSTARVVIVGGGVMGCGLAYHLAHEGWTDVVLLEKAELTSGSTWHAAGQITHSTSSFGLGKCVDYNIGLYSGKLEAETGQSVTWHGCGSFRLAYDEDEMDWLRHTLSVGRSLGFNIELVGKERIRELHPFYNLDGVLGALHTPDDGHADPSGITQALAAGARQLGVRIIRRCRATDIKQMPNGEWRVSSERGDITCEHVVNAGGTYARQMGEWSGLQLPMTSMTHHYLVTDTVPEFLDLERELPVIRDDQKVSGYIRMEQKSGLIGIYEKENPNTVWEDHCPWEAENELFEADYDRIMPWLENAMERMPALAELGIKREVHGAISHPPDGNPLIGPAPGARNYWCCCGTQIGIGWGPGLTRELARWMVHGAADISMRDYDPCRFGAYADKKWQVTKAREDYCLRHEIPFPHFNRLAGRPVKPSPLYERLKARGAVYEEVYGHERPRWFAKDGVAQKDHYSFRRTAVDDMIEQEVRAVRGSVGIMDISAFTKVEVSGAGAEALLDRLSANRLPQKTGGIVLSHLLNRRGRIELELTIVKLAKERYYLVCAAFFEQRLLDHLERHRTGGNVLINKLSDDWAAISLQGPRSRAVLAENTTVPLDNAHFRWLTAQEIDIAGRPIWAFRMSYCGELGWELHGPRDHILAVYDALWESGKAFGIANYGSFAMNAMRLEKMFKGAGELTNEVTLREADVMRFVKMDKGDFIGKEATQQGLDGDMPWICTYLSIEPDGVVDGHGGEAVLRGGDVVGSTTSVAYGPTVGKILAFAYIKPDAAVPGTALTVLIAGEPRNAVVLGEPAYDSQNQRPRTEAAVSEAAE